MLFLLALLLNVNQIDWTYCSWGEVKDGFYPYAKNSSDIGIDTSKFDTVFAGQYTGRADSLEMDSVTYYPYGDDTIRIYFPYGIYKKKITTVDTANISKDNYWTRATNFLYPKTSTDSIGIGLSSPTQKLDVNGIIRARGTSVMVGNNCRMYGYYTNALNFYMPGFNYPADNTLYYMFSADSLQAEYRQRNAQMRIYGAAGDTTYATKMATYISITHNGTNGVIGTGIGDLYLGATGGDVYISDTMRLTKGFYLGNLLIDSATTVAGTPDSIFLWYSGKKFGIAEIP